MDLKSLAVCMLLMDMETLWSSIFAARLYGNMRFRGNKVRLIDYICIFCLLALSVLSLSVVIKAKCEIHAIFSVRCNYFDLFMIHFYSWPQKYANRNRQHSHRPPMNYLTVNYLLSSSSAHNMWHALEINCIDVRIIFHKWIFSQNTDSMKKSFSLNLLSDNQNITNLCTCHESMSFAKFCHSHYIRIYINWKILIKMGIRRKLRILTAVSKSDSLPDNEITLQWFRGDCEIWEAPILQMSDMATVLIWTICCTLLF